MQYPKGMLREGHKRKANKVSSNPVIGNGAQRTGNLLHGLTIFRKHSLIHLIGILAK